MASSNPALDAWLRCMGESMVFVQVVIKRVSMGFDLRHFEDDGVDLVHLLPLAVSELRTWVQTSRDGAFRPNKLAPSLRTGWYCVAPDPSQLEEALRHLYPGGLDDWYAEQRGVKPESFRGFFGRQTGMYRAANLLSDPLAARAALANCAPASCRRRRIWEVPGLPPDSREETSVVPCFEPCGVMMEMARRAMKMEQGVQVSVSLTGDEMESLQSVLRRGLEMPDLSVREGDLAAPLNPRRLRWVLQKLETSGDVRTESESL